MTRKIIFLIMISLSSVMYAEEIIEEKIDEKFVDEDVQKQIEKLEIRKTGVFWTKPDFLNQTTALGWTPQTFDVPPGFQDRVNFWIDIYSKYTTRQVLLHDARYMDIVYKVLDFSEIEANKDLTAMQKEREKKNLVKTEKRAIKEQLQRIQKNIDNPTALSKEDRVIYDKFKFIPDKNKFIEAQSKHRLRMQLGQKDRFILGIYFSGRYIREMEKIFRDEGLPIELTRLPFVESTFNLYATSRVGASGIWQFMRSTGRLFMKIDSIKDTRNDPLEATKAAAKFLRMNYKILNSWPLALTAYNHGAQGVGSVVKKLKTEDINEIVWNTTRRRFGFASENFYAEFLAALHVESHAGKYFGRIDVATPVLHEDFPLPRASYFGEISQLAENIIQKEPGKEVFDMLRLYNPYFTKPVIANIRRIPEGYNLRVPVGTVGALKELLVKNESFKPKPELSNGVYRVLPGDNLSTIAQEFNVSVRALQESNGLNEKSILRPGQRMIIP